MFIIQIPTKHRCNRWKVCVNSTTSVPKSVSCLVLDKVRLLSVSEDILQCSCWGREREMVWCAQACNKDMLSMEWMLPFWILVWDQYSLLLKYEILKKLVTHIVECIQIKRFVLEIQYGVYFFEFLFICHRIIYEENRSHLPGRAKLDPSRGGLP